MKRPKYFLITGGCFFLLYLYLAAVASLRADGLTVQPVLIPGSNTIQLTLQGINQDWVYRIESSPAPGSSPFVPVATGVPGQTVFTLSLPGGRANYYRVAGTNRFDYPIPTGAFAGPARTPALGYNSWLGNGIGISETMIMGIADAMATNGMKAAGYKYVVLDQGWSGSGRNADGTPTISPNFPHGMAYLANYIHSKGLLMGLYTVASSDYNGFIGSGGYMAQDALTYSKWGVDYVKMDGSLAYRSDYETFGNAFLSTGRQLWFAPGTGDITAAWLQAETSSVRGCGGIHNLADLVPGGVTDSGTYYSGWEILLEHIDYISQYASAAGPGHWNDPDALDVSVGPVGNPAAQFFAKPEMAIFSVLACNLLWDYVPPAQNAGLESLFYMTNSEVIAVNQDALGVQGGLVATNDSGLGQVWCKPLGTTNGNVKAVCLFNRSTNTSQTITVPWNAIGLSNGPALVRDLFQHASVGNYATSYTATLQPRDCQLVTITSGAPPFLPPGTNYLSDQGYLAGWTNGSAAMFDVPGMLWPAKDMSASKTPLSVNHKTYAKGLGLLANCQLEFALGGLASTFHAEIGIDDVFYSQSRAVFLVLVDDVQLYNSGVIVNGSPTQIIDIDVSGGQKLTLQLVTAEAGGVNINDSCDWGDAYIVCP